ncbi:MAG: flagellar basal body-associated FliL family protein [Acidimicrobiales bacterium]|nr:flagellar basal body-associated FliL family protein [Hyphomonadaceae bacterium]RZV44775.1 MAG: flagellar basal body-associated FliL family protein [Acidimicrobiales bacterium]
MKKILFPVLMIVFVVVGGLAGDFLRNGSSGEEADNQARKSDHTKSKKKDDGHSKKDDGDKKKKSDKKSKDKKKKDGKDAKGDDGSSYAGGENVYLKFKRQFVVPVMQEGAIEALVIMNLNLEMNDNAPENAYSYEPKLRDAIMRELLALSNAGVFGADLTSAESYEKIRENLLTACQDVIKEGIDNILILDVARQEQ